MLAIGQAIYFGVDKNWRIWYRTDYNYFSELLQSVKWSKHNCQVRQEQK